MKYQLDQSSFVKLNQGCNLTNLEEILNIILNMGKYSRAKYLHPFCSPAEIGDAVMQTLEPNNNV